ncbi:MAG: prephenate dehydratase [Candidatus Woesearchaeota archaeon]
MEEIITLGPEGTFAHGAAKEIARVFDAPIRFEKTISKVFDRLSMENVIVVPLENSDAGSVGQTVDNLYRIEGVRIITEIDIPIHHNLCSFVELKDITDIYAHPQSAAQCEDYLSKLAHAAVIETSSNARSAQLAKENKGSAILPKIASDIYGVPLIIENIENTKNNTTRFIVCSKKSMDGFWGKKTSIIIDPKEDRPGLLYEILGILSDVNLTKIESRPSKRKLGDYIFYIEMETNPDLDKLSKIAEVKFLGSYGRYNA